MKTVFAAFRQFLRAIWGDAMLAACLVAPILMAVLFRWGVPKLEIWLTGLVGAERVLSPYYAVFDLFLSLMTPLMLCFAGVMVVLEELDDGTAKYLMVTPLGKKGYLFSRVGVLTVASIVYEMVLTALFTLSDMPLWQNALAAVANALVSVSVAMMVVGFAKNKVEGMALVKLSGFFILGFIAAYFVARPMGYLAGVLPGYWLGLMALDGSPWWALPAMLVAGVWIALLYRRFAARVLR